MSTKISNDPAADAKKKELEKKRLAEAKTFAKELFLAGYPSVLSAVVSGALPPDQAPAAVERLAERSVEHVKMFNSTWNRRKGIFAPEKKDE